MEILHGDTLTLSIEKQGIESEICMWNDRLAVFTYERTILTVYDVMNGSLILRRKARESILKAVYCTFMNYGTCIAAMLHDGCVIWCEDGTAYSVAFPCRMQRIYPLDNGLLFERIDDQLSINTSFTLSNTLRSFPNYFSLSSPLMLPKPILQVNPGMSLQSFSNQSVIELSRLLNISQIDTFNSRMDEVDSEGDSYIVSSVSQWNMIIVYNRIQKTHTFLRLIPLRNSDIPILPETELLEIAMNDISLSDGFIQTLNYPDWSIIPLFSLPDCDTPFEHILVIPNDSTAFIYCCSKSQISCYSIPIDSLSTLPSDDDMDLHFVSTVPGSFVCELRAMAFIPKWSFLSNSILIIVNGSFQILFNGTLIQIPVRLPREGISPNLPFFCQSNTLITYSSDIYQLTHYYLTLTLSPTILTYYTLYPHSFSLSLPSTFNALSIRPILLMLDDAWIRNDTCTLDFLLHYISQPLISSFFSSKNTLTVS